MTAATQNGTISDRAILRVSRCCVRVLLDLEQALNPQVVTAEGLCHLEATRDELQRALEYLEKALPERQEEWS